MSLHRMSAGAGYRYLLASTATGDVQPSPGTAMTAYYAASGTPPGRWYGTGLGGLGTDDNRVMAGSVVTEVQLAALFGAGRDPVTGQGLGNPYRVYAGVQERIARRVAALPEVLDPNGRLSAVEKIREEEAHRPTPQAVAGFDLTFTAPKSVSVLWALTDPDIQQKVLTAHHRAVADSMAFLERTALFTRTGKDGIAQVTTRGMIAVGFDHWDTRAGDPNLHTHVVVANKVQGLDGVWRSVDSRALYHAAVMVSELYDDLLADHLAAVLPVSFSWRSRGQRRTPAHEIDGITDPVLAEFSTRSTDIDGALTTAMTDFRTRYGRYPTRPEVLRLRQTATLTTRPAKASRRLLDMIEHWRSRAHAAFGLDAAAINAAVLGGDHPVRYRHDQIDPATMDHLAGVVLDQVMDRRATWTLTNIQAEVLRASRGLRMVSTGDRLALLDRISAAVLGRCSALFPTDPVVVTGKLLRPDGTSVFTRVEDQRYSHRRLLTAEEQLLAANTSPLPGVPTVSEDLARTVASAPQPGRGTNPAAVHLAGDQVDAVIAVATSSRVVDVLVGPAGSGKTTTMIALRTAWESAHGPGSVIGLAPSATGAAGLAEALGIGCENTAKWLHETSKPDSGVDPEWAMRAGQLVIIDEASLTGTLTLDNLRVQAEQVGAKLLLVGDHAQLSAVQAGGAFGLLARRGHAQHLFSLWRFTHRWEAGATRTLRNGDPACLDTYDTHGRLHAGTAEMMLEAAYTAWQHDIDAGKSSLLVAADSHTVDALNTRAHHDRVAGGQVTGPTIALGTTSTGGQRGRVGLGDLVLTRRNDRSLTYPGGHVRNGTLWTVTAVHPDGALDLTATTRHANRAASSTAPPLRVTVPAEYVLEHVDPGYAVTVHRAQGVTVGTSHVLATPSMGRRPLYVGMTRGRDANHVYLATDAIDTDCEHNHVAPEPGTARAMLEAILGDDRIELSATEARHAATDQLHSLHRLSRIRDTLTPAAEFRHNTDSRGDLNRDRIQDIIIAASAHGTRHDGGATATGEPAVRSAVRGDEDPAVPALGTGFIQRTSLDDDGFVEGDRFDTPADHSAGVAPHPQEQLPNRADPASMSAQVDSLMTERIDALALHAITTAATWLPPAPEPGADEADRHAWVWRVAIDAARRDITSPTSTEPIPGSERDAAASNTILDALLDAASTGAPTDDWGLSR